MGALATVSVAVLGGFVAYLATKREHRRQLYSEAVRAAVAWQELLYRVRRRSDDDERDLVHRFHDAQHELSFFEAWVASDSKYMARSFERLVTAVKTETGSLIQEAWRTEPRSVSAGASPDDKHPNLTEERAAFMADVRSHLSPLLWRRLALVWRNREGVPR